MASVGGDGQGSADAATVLDAYAGNAAAVFDEAGGFGVHQQVEVGQRFAVLGDEIEEVPLRHQRDELAVRGHVGEIGDRQVIRADLRRQVRHLVVRDLEELIEQAEFVHQLHGRGMNGVAAEIAEEVAVLFEHGDVDTGAGQQIAQHDSSGAAAGDATGRVQRLIHRQTLRVNY